MKSKKITTIALVLVLVAVCAASAVTAFAADVDAPVGESAVAVEETAKTKDKSAKTDKSGKGSMTFVGIDAVAAEVLGVSEESLSGLNHADQLYATLAETGKVDEFKTALIAAKQKQYDAKAEYGKFSAEELAEKLAGYTRVINGWDGTTELIVSSATTKAK